MYDSDTFDEIFWADRSDSFRRIVLGEPKKEDNADKEDTTKNKETPLL